MGTGVAELFELDITRWPDYEAPQGATNITFHTGRYHFWKIENGVYYRWSEHFQLWELYEVVK